MKDYYVFPTMITPYKEDGSVDCETAEKYVQWYFDKGCNGVFAICQSSEIFYLSLEEKLKLNTVVWNKAKELEKKSGKKFTVVSSGHTADSIEQQAYELNAVAESGTDALILITNRLDLHNLGDKLWINNAEKLLSLLPGDIKLGLYECPYPYKRLVTPEILDWCLSTDRFVFMKDTSCDADIIRNRCRQLEKSDFKLLNANCQTMLESLNSGCRGYCGIMANFHPELYVWLCGNFDRYPEKAKLLQSFIGTSGFTESGIPYPLTAKYNMCLEGIPTVNYARNRKSDELTDYAKSCTEQMKYLAEYFENTVINGWEGMGNACKR